MATKPVTKIDPNDYTKGGTASIGTKIKPSGNNSVGFAMPHGANVNAAQAMNGQDVIAQDPATRLWQSFNTMGQNQIRESDRMYDRNLSEADRQAMSRGMGRSSYNNQTMANIRQERTEAANKINADTVAQYQQALNALQQQQQQQANWQAEFDANQQYQQQQGAMQYLQMILQNGGTPSDELLAQAGLSRADYNAMKRQQATGGGGRPTGGKKPWQLAGFSSEAEYNNAMSHGYDNPTKYREWLLQHAAQNATGQMPFNPNASSLLNSYNQQQAQQQAQQAVSNIPSSLPYHTMPVVPKNKH